MSACEILLVSLSKYRNMAKGTATPGEIIEERRIPAKYVSSDLTNPGGDA